MLMITIVMILRADKFQAYSAFPKRAMMIAVCEYPFLVQKTIIAIVARGKLLRPDLLTLQALGLVIQSEDFFL